MCLPPFEAYGKSTSKTSATSFVDFVTDDTASRKWRLPRQFPLAWRLNIATRERGNVSPVCSPAFAIRTTPRALMARLGRRHDRSNCPGRTATRPIRGGDEGRLGQRGAH